MKLKLKLGKIKAINGQEFVCNYGEEYINNIITDSFRTGYKYLGCGNCKEIHKKQR